MDELMEMLCDYVSLALKVGRGLEVPGGDRARWLALSKVIPGNGEAPSPGDDDEGDGAPVEVTGLGGFESAQLMAVSRDGMRLQLNHPLPEGAHTVVRVLAPEAGYEYTFPCKVQWSDGDAMGIVYDGAPVRSPLGRALRVDWQRRLDLRTGWGARVASATA